MNIPEEAVEAGAIEHYGHPWDSAPEWAKAESRRIAREVLQAAAPFIAAQAFRDAAQDTNCMDDSDLLVCKADELDPR